MKQYLIFMLASTAAITVLLAFSFFRLRKLLEEIRARKAGR